MLNTALVLFRLFIYKLIRYFTMGSSTLKSLVKKYLSVEGYISLAFNKLIYRMSNCGI